MGTAPPSRMLPGYRLPWHDLCARVRSLRRDVPSDPVWGLLEGRPFNEDAIERLADWKVLREGEGARCYARLRLITLDPRFQGYMRDEALFHELVHAHYWPELNDTPIDRSEWHAHSNAIVEWLARKARAQPALLARAISTFGLERHVYDRASYLAYYPWAKRQMTLPGIAHPMHIPAVLGPSSADYPPRFVLMSVK